MNFSIDLFKAANCTVNEKKELLPLIEQIIDLSLMANKEGLLALEDIVENLEYQFLKDLLLHVINGIDTSALEHIILTEVENCTETNAELLKKMIIADAVLTIHSGKSSKILELILHSYLGEEIEAEYGF